MPLTVPVLLTVAIPVLPELHTPPAVPLLNTVVEPTHITGVPVIADGSGFTVTTTVTAQPVPNEYVILAVPGTHPVTSPLVEFIVAINVLPLLHTPPPAPLPKVVLASTQTLFVPVIVVGAVFTVIAFVAAHPLVGVKVIVATPGFTPATTPMLFTVAVVMLLLVHVPLLVGIMVRVAEPLTHTPPAPLMVGAAFTVIVLVTLQLPIA